MRKGQAMPEDHPYENPAVKPQPEISAARQRTMKSEPRAEPRATEQDKRRTHELRMELVRRIFWLAAISVSTLPLRWVYNSVHDLAGRETTLSVGFSATLSLY